MRNTFLYRYEASRPRHGPGCRRHARWGHPRDRDPLRPGVRSLSILPLLEKAEALAVLALPGSSSPTHSPVAFTQDNAIAFLFPRHLVNVAMRIIRSISQDTPLLRMCCSGTHWHVCCVSGRLCDPRVPTNSFTCCIIWCGRTGLITFSTGMFPVYSGFRKTVTMF